ncbi:MAG TPA: DUF3830 family protein, partial [Rudaea sp.]
ARIETDLAPLSCRALLDLLPYAGPVVHARWSGEALWSPLGARWRAGSVLQSENATSEPRPGQILLYAGSDSEPELLIPYGETRFACKAGTLRGNPVLTLIDRLDALARAGRAILQSGAATLRVELDNTSGDSLR